MSDLFSYRVSDFILFSSSAYFRQFEIYNRDIWPLHIVAVLFVCLLIYILWKRPAWAGRVSAAVLVISWLWVGYGFLYQRFYLIHVVANWYALGFVIQAGLIAWYGLLKDRFIMPGDIGVRSMACAGVIVGILLAYPLIAVITGRPWQQLEMFALAPDPTAIVTLGLLLYFRTPGTVAAKILFVIPVLWLLVSYTTLFVM